MVLLGVRDYRGGLTEGVGPPENAIGTGGIVAIVISDD